MQQLIIYLHADETIHPDWMILDDALHVKQHVQQGNVEELSHLAAECEVIVMVPAEEVVLTSANLPKMNRSQLAKALPFALEDQVIDDVDILHFVYADNQ